MPPSPPLDPLSEILAAKLQSLGLTGTGPANPEDDDASLDEDLADVVTPAAALAEELDTAAAIAHEAAAALAEPPELTEAREAAEREHSMRSEPEEAPWLVDDSSYTDHLDHLDHLDYDADFQASVGFPEPPPVKLPQAAGSPPPKAGLICFADVRPQPVTWLWKDRVSIGAVTVLDGDPGTGKTSIALDLMARITTGRPMPFADKPLLPPSNVLFISVEDSPAETLVPRATAAGGDLRRFFTSDTHITLPSGGARFRQLVKDSKAVLLCIDPGIAFFDSTINANSDQEARRVMANLVSIASSERCAALFIRHFNKAQHAAALYRGGGSIAIGGAARSVLMTGWQKKDKKNRVLTSAKNNLGPTPDAALYDLVDSPLGVVTIRWKAPTALTAEDMLANTLPDAALASPGAPLGSGAPKPRTADDELKQEIVSLIYANQPAKAQSLRRELRIGNERLYRLLEELEQSGQLTAEGSGPQRRYRAAALAPLGKDDDAPLGKDDEAWLDTVLTDAPLGDAPLGEEETE